MTTGAGGASLDAAETTDGASDGAPLDAFATADADASGPSLDATGSVDGMRVDAANGDSAAPPDARPGDMISIDQGGPSCSNPPYLRGLNECSPGTPGCYVLSDEWRLLGPVTKIPETTTCHYPPLDQCGCDPDAGGTGRSCPVRQTCVVTTRPSDNTGPARPVNVCLELCLTDAECSGGARCWEGYCMVSHCVLDSQCSQDACGHCTQLRTWGHIGEINVLRVPTCIYEGPCGPSSCAGCYDGPGPYMMLGPTHGCP